MARKTRRASRRGATGSGRGGNLGERIAQAYRAAGMNRSQFQRALGVAYSTIVMWESDRTRPNAENLRAISEVTGVPIPELLGPNGASHGSSVEPPPAWHEFLRTPHGRALTAAERRTLLEMRFHGVEPTVETYHAILVGLRLADSADGG